MKCCSTSHQQHTRLGFLSIQMICIGMGMIFLYYGEDIMSYLTPIALSVGIVFECSGDTEASCLGVFTIYRESFALVLFYLIMAIASSIGGQASMTINRDF